MFLNPVILLISFLIDLLNLPNLLLKDEKGFEFKYQNSNEHMDSYQVDQLFSIFKRIFYSNFEQKYQDKASTFIDSMI